MGACREEIIHKGSDYMKKKEIMDCSHCNEWNKELRQCGRIGKCDENKGKKGICWMKSSECEY